MTIELVDFDKLLLLDSSIEALKLRDSVFSEKPDRFFIGTCSTKYKRVNEISHVIVSYLSVLIVYHWCAAIKAPSPRTLIVVLSSRATSTKFASWELSSRVNHYKYVRGAYINNSLTI